tara:strand:+ start:73 stop:930 length:858 start_codon:yes stop_codon:yes gene_type:complete
MFWKTYLDTVPSIEDPDDADSQWIYDIEKEYTFSRERWGLDAEQARDIETSFIDSVWGTGGAGVDSYDPEDDLRAWEPDASGQVRSGFDATWGTDLVRIYDKDLKPGTPEMTDYLTKSGPIDWGHYWTDESYVQAFEDLGVGQHDQLSEVEMATKIREARGQIESGGSSSDDDDLKEPTKWEGMYDKNKIRLDEDGNLFIKGKRQEGYLETMEANRYDPVSDEEWQADREEEAKYTQRDFKDLGTKEYRKTLNLPSRSKFGLSIKEGGGVKPKRPANLPPSWGKI